jgi:predicted O-methyltransferase YrrM
MDFIDPKIQAYAERFSSPEPEALAALNRETNLKVLYPRMLSGHIQGRMLSMFSKMLRPTKILEIGTYTGYSAICMAEGLAEGGALVTIEFNPELEDIIHKYFKLAGVEDRCRLVIGDATVEAEKVEGPIDLVFLDADKENYVRYFDIVLPKMRSGGVILADNVLWSGRVLDESERDKETQGLRDFVQHVHGCEAVEEVLLPVRDGIMVVMKK